MFAHCILIVDCSGEMPSNSNITYASHMLKSTFSGQQFCHCHCRSIFICLVVAASKICKITQNSEKIRTYSSSVSSKVVDLCASRKSHLQLPISHEQYR